MIKKVVILLTWFLVLLTNNSYSQTEPPCGRIKVKRLPGSYMKHDTCFVIRDSIYHRIDSTYQITLIGATCPYTILSFNITIDEGYCGAGPFKESINGALLSKSAYLRMMSVHNYIQGTINITDVKVKFENGTIRTIPVPTYHIRLK